MLHAVIRAHLDGFLHEAAHRGDGAGLPGFIERVMDILDLRNTTVRCGLGPGKGAQDKA